MEHVRAAKNPSKGLLCCEGLLESEKKTQAIMNDASDSKINPDSIVEPYARLGMASTSVP